MILALKTADATTQAWLFAAGRDHDAAPGSPAALRPVATLEWASGRDLSEQLLGRLADFLAEHQRAFSDLTGLIIFSGPGSFTSLRIGHAVANALADNLGLPIAGAQGDDWLATARAALAATPAGRPAVPFYGAAVHITRPKS